MGCSKRCSSICHPSRWTRPLVLSEEAVCFSKRLVAANLTHTRWYNMSPLIQRGQHWMICEFRSWRAGGALHGVRRLGLHRGSNQHLPDESETPRLYTFPPEWHGFTGAAPPAILMGLTEQSFGSKRFHKAVLSRESLLWAKGEAVGVCGCAEQE